MPKRTLVHGIGINDVFDAPTRGCMAYSRWKSMLGRCYSEKLQSYKGNMSYVGCIVADEWHIFSNFKKWFYDNYKGGIVQIDKDIVGIGKIYSPEFCLLVDPQVNCEKAHAKNYLFVSPAGEVVSVYNLKKFCSDNELSDSKMCLLFQGKRNSHKGWCIPKTLEQS